MEFRSIDQATMQVARRCGRSGDPGNVELGRHGRNRSNVWHYAGVNTFGGSGTTLVACERTGRRARLIEIAPRYVDVSVRRFQALAKVDAIHADTGATFDDLAIERGQAN